MTFWQLLWTLMFMGSIGLFAVLAVVVTIGGYRDIRWMFDKLKPQEDASEESDA